MVRLNSSSKIVIRVIALCWLLQMLNVTSICQDDRSKKDTKVSSELQHQSKEDERNKQEEQILKWKLVLGDLRAETNSISQDNFKPYALAQVANAYWEIDKSISKGLFREAFELARSLDSKYGDKHDIMYHVTSMAGRRDSSLSKYLTETLIDEAAPRKQTGEAINDYLLKPRTGRWHDRGVDPAARNIFGNAQRDTVLADHVFITYLNANSNLPLNQLLLLGGYPFGYAESVGFMEGHLDNLLGSHVPPPPMPNPFLAQFYLDVAYKQILATINQASSLAPTNSEALSGLALFSLNYLMPEVMKFAPDALSAWKQLYQTALANTPIARRELVQKQLRFVNRLRKYSGIKPLSDDPSYYSKSAVDTLGIAEKMQEDCEKDLFYTKYVLSSDLKRGYSEVLDASNKIRDTKARASVKELVHFKKAMMSDGSGAPDGVDNIASQVTAPELNVLLYAKIALRAASKNKREAATETLKSAYNFVSSIESESTKAAALLAVIRAAKEVHQDRLKELVVELITQIDKIDGGNIDTLSLSYSVKTDCNIAASDPPDSDLAYKEKMSFLDTISKLKFINADELIAICAKITDATTRIRLTAQIAASALDKLRTTQAASPSQ